MFYPICTSLDRIQSFTLDLNWNGSKRVHLGERFQTGADSGSVPVRIQQVQCRRKAYLYPYWYGSVWIRSSVNGVKDDKRLLMPAGIFFMILGGWLLSWWTYFIVVFGFV